MYNEAYYAAGDKLEAVFLRAGVLRPDQLACYHYVQTFSKQAIGINSIGFGAGGLELHFHRNYYDVYAIDPSEAAHEIVKHEFTASNLRFLKIGFREFANDTLRYKGPVIFCQSIEHIPHEDIKYGIPILAKNHHLIVITNTVNWHPIMPNNDDHITLVDDELFNWIASFGETLFRYKSHLVVQT